MSETINKQKKIIIVFLFLHFLHGIYVPVAIGNVYSFFNSFVAFVFIYVIAKLYEKNEIEKNWIKPFMPAMWSSTETS